MIRIALLFCLLPILVPIFASAGERITVFAAASLTDAMERAVSDFESQSDTEVVVSFAASSVLARQIDAGAPADIYISADVEWMDWLAARGAIEEESRRVVAGNDLVIVSNGLGAKQAEPASLLADRFAMGDPNHVPAGRYAKAALSNLGLWEQIKERAIFGENVRVALEFVRRREVGAAIVYGSDQKAAKDLVRAYVFPEETHPPIRYPAAMIQGAAPEARKFLEFLSSDEGQTIFEESGFSPVRSVRP